MCMEQMQKHAALPPPFKTRIFGVRSADTVDVVKSIKNKSVDYVIVAHREAGAILGAMPRDIVPIYIWRGSTKSLSDHIYALLGLVDPNTKPSRSDYLGGNGVSTVLSAPWSEDEEAAIQIAYDKVGAAVISEMFPFFREALPDGPPRTLQAFFEQCQRQFSGEVTWNMTRAQADETSSEDDDPEVRSLLEAAEQMRATKQAARLEAERIAREKAEEERREVERQIKRVAAEKVEEERREAERLESERLAREREERKRAAQETAQRALEEKLAAEAQAELQRQAALKAEERAEAALSPEERAERTARQHEVIRSWTRDPALSRNARCPCGKTSKKFKQCCYQKFSEEEARMKAVQKKQMVAQQLRELLSPASLETAGTGESSAEPTEVSTAVGMAALAHIAQLTYDKTAMIGRGVVAIHEKVATIDENHRSTKRDLISTLRAIMSQNDELLRNQQAQTTEITNIKRDLDEQAEMLTTTLDTVVKLVENIVFVRDYVLANLPNKQVS